MVKKVRNISFLPNILKDKQNHTFSLKCSDVILGETMLGPKTGSETGRAHWAAAMAKPGVKVFMWHTLDVDQTI